MNEIQAIPAATREQWEMLATARNFTITGEAEFHGEDITPMGLYAKLIPSLNDNIRRPGAANLWWDAADHGFIRSLRHALTIIRADMIRTEVGDAGDLAQHYADYPDARAIATHVLDWAYMFERQGFDLSPRQHRVEAAWEYVIADADDYDTREDFFESPAFTTRTN